MGEAKNEQLQWIPLYLDRLLGSPRWQGMADFQRGWYMQLLLLCARSQRPGYLPLDEQLWKLAGAHSRPMWENHKGEVMACFKFRQLDGTDWIYNERLLYTIEHQQEKLTQTLERSRKRKDTSSSLSISDSDLSTKSKPSLEEVRAYCEERESQVDAQQWLDYYTSNGWKVGRNAMKDWKAAVRTWEKNGYGSQSKAQSKRPADVRRHEATERIIPEESETCVDCLATDIRLCARHAAAVVDRRVRAAAAGGDD